MKRTFVVCIFFLASLLGLEATYAQSKNITNEFNDDKRHSINLEVAGRGFIIGSLSYEYLLKPQFSLGLGLGFTNISSGEINRNNNGNTETGKFLDTSTSQQLYANYFIGKRKHKLLITGGVAHFLVTSRNKFPSETERGTESAIFPNLGLGYQLTGNRIQARLVAYGVRFPQPSGWFPEYMPWGGLSFGYRF